MYNARARALSLSHTNTHTHTRTGMIPKTWENPKHEHPELKVLFVLFVSKPGLVVSQYANMQRVYPLEYIHLNIYTPSYTHVKEHTCILM